MRSITWFTHLATAILCALYSITTAASADSSRPSAPAAELAEHANALPVLLNHYRNTKTFSTKVRRCVVDANGERDPAVAMQKVKLSYGAPNQIAIESDDARINTNGEKAILLLPHQKVYMVFPAPDMLTSRDLAATNQYLAEARCYPIIDVLTGQLPPMPTRTVAATCKGQHVLRLEYREPYAMRLFVEPSTGKLLRSQVALTEDQSYWIQADYFDQQSSDELANENFTTTPPADYIDMTEVAKRSQPSYYYQQAMKRAGTKAPDFSAKTLEGTEVHLRTMRGHVVVLDFWATWCPPCIESIPQLEQAKQNMADEKVLFWGMNMDSGEERENRLRAFMTKHKIKSTQLLIENETIPNLYGVQKIPTIIIIDSKGILRNVHLGTVKSPDEITEKIRPLLMK